MNWVTFQATCFDFPAVCVNWCLHFSQVNAFAMLTHKPKIIVIAFCVGRYDRARGVEIGNKDVKLEYLEEAFTTSNWIVRIYKVKPPNNRW